MSVSTTPLCILIVEDSDSAADLLIEPLKKGGFELQQQRVDSAAALQAALQRQRWDLVLSAIKLTAFGAGAALDVLRQSSPEIPLIVIGESGDEAAATELMRAGARDYLMRGDLQRLLPLLQRELGDAGERLRWRQAEDAVHEGAERLRAITNSTSHAIVSVDENNRISFFSRGAQAIFGYSEAETLGQPTTLLTPQEQRAAHDAGFQRYVQTRVDHLSGKVVELTARRKNGELFPIELSLSHSVVRERLLFTAIIDDISERSAAQKKILKLSRMYAALSECNEAIVRCTNEEELFHAVCRATVQAGGLKFAWVGMVDDGSNKLLPVAHFGEGASYIQGIEASVASDDPLGQGLAGTCFRENRSVWCQDFHNDVRTVPWQARAKPFGWRSAAVLPLHRNKIPVGIMALYLDEVDSFDAEIRELLVKMAADISFAMDSIEQRNTLDRHAQELELGRTALLGVLEEQRSAHAALSSQSAELHTEITERGKVEQALRDSEQRFRLLIEKSLAGMFVSRDDQYLYTNPRLDQILGYGPGQLVGMRGSDMVRPEDLPVMIAARQQLRDGASTAAYEVHMNRLDGSVVELGVQLVLAEFEGQRTTVGMVQDIGERKRAQNEIKGYIARLEHTTESTLRAVALMIEQRDPYTAGHQRRVGELAAALGAEMGLSEHTVKGLRLTGYVHDIGKISVPAELLSKPSKLSAIEFELIKSHAQSGYDILKNVDFPWPVAEVILQHHERPDGSGYPRGLKGDTIILEARVVAVADVVEAMTLHRPYRHGLGIERALAEIEHGRDKRYDAAVADACLRLFRDKGFVLI